MDIWFGLSSPKPEPSTPMRFGLTLQNELRINTFWSLVALDVSPDGKRIVFPARGEAVGDKNDDRVHARCPERCAIRSHLCGIGGFAMGASGEPAGTQVDFAATDAIVTLGSGGHIRVSVSPAVAESEGGYGTGSSGARASAGSACYARLRAVVVDR